MIGSAQECTPNDLGAFQLSWSGVSPSPAHRERGPGGEGVPNTDETHPNDFCRREKRPFLGPKRMSYLHTHHQLNLGRLRCSTDEMS